MVRAEAVVECVGDHLIRHHPLVPRGGEAQHPLRSTGRLEHRLHDAKGATFVCFEKEARAPATSGPA